MYDAANLVMAANAFQYSEISTKKVLKTIALGGLILSSLISPATPIAYKYLSKEWRNYRREDLGRILRRVNKTQLIKLKETSEGNVEIELSEKGKRKLLTYNYQEIKLKRKRDGKFRIIIFDIPNNKKVARDSLRKKLDELSFKKIQKSVFISPYPCKNEIEFIINYLGLNKHVILFQLGPTEIGESYIFKKNKTHY